MGRESSLQLVSDNKDWRIIQDLREANIYHIGIRKSDNKIFEIGYKDPQKFISENRM